MGIKDITDDELSNLGEEERAALEAEEGDSTAATTPTEEAALLAEGEKGNEDGDTEKDTTPAAAGEAGNGTLPVEAGTESKGANGTDKEIPAAASTETVTESSAPFVPRYVAPVVEGFEEKMAALDKQFEDGEIALKEYNQQRDDLNRRQLKGEIAAEQDQQIADQRWDWEVNRFIRDTRTNEGIDYDKPLLNAALDQAVKTLAAAKDEQGNLMHIGRDGEWFLGEAHKMVVAELGLTGKVNGSPPPKANGKPTVRPVPVTLSQLPNADQNDDGTADGDSAFAKIDQLFTAGKDEEGEMALARMSKLDQQRYLEGR